MATQATAREPLLVLVPDEDGMATLTRAEGLRPLRYDPDAALPPEAHEAEAMVVEGGDVEVLLAAMRELPRLRIVQTLSAGVDGWAGRIPPGVALSNARGAHGGATAEWAVAVLLSIYRELPAFAASQAAESWDEHWTDTLDGKRVLVLGAGDLARNLERRLLPFGVEVTLSGRHEREDIVALADVRGLLPHQDAVVVMLPLSATTRGLVDAGFLARMPDHAILVNAARGPIVVTDDLLVELRSGRLRAALDVTDPEPLPPGHPLWTAPGVLITPHVGGGTHGAEERQWTIAAEQLSAFARGEEPANLISTP